MLLLRLSLGWFSREGILWKRSQGRFSRSDSAPPTLTLALAFNISTGARHARTSAHSHFPHFLVLQVHSVLPIYMLQLINNKKISNPKSPPLIW